MSFGNNGEKITGMGSVNSLGKLKKSEKNTVNGLSESSNTLFQDELRLSSIKTQIESDNEEEAFDIFTSGYATPGFAEKVLESVPVFAAFVAKMVVDEIMKKLNLEEEKARELQSLAEKYSQGIKRVDPI